MKFFKKILLVFITLVSVTAISLWLLTRIVNPDLIRGYVNTQLTILTAQPSKINGEIHWQIFPQPGIRVTDVVVGDSKSNAPYTLKLDNLLFTLNIKPLLRAKLIFSAIKVNGFEMNILTKPSVAHDKPTIINQKSTQPPELHKKFAVEHFLLSNGTINFLNENKKITIRKLQLGTERLNINQSEFPLQFKADIEFSNHELLLKSHTSFKGTVIISPEFLAEPLSKLADLHVKGQLILQNLNINKLTIHRLGGKVTLNKAVLTISPLTIGVYQGEAVGDLKYNFANKNLKLNQTGTGLQTTKLMMDLFNTAPMQGIMDFSIHAEADLTKRKIFGHGTLSIHDGSLNKINVNQVIAFTSDKINQYQKGEIQELTEFFNREQLEKANGFKGLTPFKLATIQYQFDNTKITAKSMFLQTDTLNLKGEGEYIFSNKAIHSTFLAKVSTDNEKFLQIQTILGGAFPLIINGTLEKPIIFPDTKNLTAALTKQWVGEALAKPMKQIKTQLESYLGARLNLNNNE